MTEAIIDNTALNYLVRLNEHLASNSHQVHTDIIHSLSLLLRTIHVPTAVKNEFAYAGALSSDAQRVLDAIEQGKMHFRLCTSYDAIRLAFMSDQWRVGIHAGEAEALSQSQKIGVRYFITDDADCIKAAAWLEPNVRCYSSLVILAALDLHGYLLSREQTLHLFFIHVKPVARRQSVAALLRNAYQEAAKIYGIALSRKELSKLSRTKEWLR